MADTEFHEPTEKELKSERDQECVVLRRRLHETIESAQGDIHCARDLLVRLDELGDVDYSGGHADVEHFLDAADRNLRAAQALKPSNRGK